MDRFWNKVNKTKTCWLWTAGKIRGYGTFSVEGKPWRAHRYSYHIANGSIPDGSEIMHSCHNPACVNPDHLIAGSHLENMQMSAKAGRMIGAIGHSKEVVDKCLSLRKEGKMLKEIYAITGIPAATISNWCRGYVVKSFKPRVKY